MPVPAVAEDLFVGDLGQAAVDLPAGLSCITENLSFSRGMKELWV
jgi:hypothetical protein